MIETRIINLDIEIILHRYDPSNRRSRYFSLLMEENQKLNLVSRETSPDDLERLTAESLFPLTMLGGSFDSYLDIGSGGGMPALPIMLSGAVSGEICLIERTQKKAAALRRLLYGLELEADIIAGTFEETKFSDKFGLITMRLVKLTKPILKHVIAALKPEGKFVYYGIPAFDCGQLTAVSYSYSGTNADSVKTFTILQKN